MNLISLNSNDKLQYKIDAFMLMGFQLLNTKSNPIKWRGFFYRFFYWLTCLYSLCFVSKKETTLFHQMTTNLVCEFWIYLWQYLKMCSLCLFHFYSSLYKDNTMCSAHSVDSQNIIWEIKLFFSKNYRKVILILVLKLWNFH